MIQVSDLDVIRAVVNYMREGDYESAIQTIELRRELEPFDGTVQPVEGDDHYIEIVR